MNIIQSKLIQRLFEQIYTVHYHSTHTTNKQTNNADNMWCNFILDHDNSELCFQRLCEAHNLQCAPQSTWYDTYVATCYASTSTQFNYANDGGDPDAEEVDWTRSLVFLGSPSAGQRVSLDYARGIRGGNVAENLFGRLLMSPPDSCGGPAEHDDLPNED